MEARDRICGGQCGASRRRGATCGNRANLFTPSKLYTFQGMRRGFDKTVFMLEWVWEVTDAKSEVLIKVAQSGIGVWIGERIRVERHR